MDPEEYRKKLKKDILNIIEQSLRNGQMNTERAKAIAKMLLEKLHPNLTLEQIFKIAPSLDDYFKELAPVVMSVEFDHQKQIGEIISKKAVELIHLGRIKEAKDLLTSTIKPK